jgi:hypothetical protein
MTDDLPLSPSVVTLTRELVDREPTDPASAELAGWLAASPRFRRFAEANRSKIRKKLRSAADPDAALDVRAELEVARLLLADARFEVTFEAYGSRVVGPDFTVTDRSGRAFNLEVTRVRRAVGPGAIAAIVLGKLRQLPPSTPNGLVLAVDGQRAAAVDVDAAIRGLRARADARDEPFFTARGMDGTSAFWDRFLRLGAVFVWCERGIGEARAAVWTNRSARIALPARASAACLACLRAD